MVESSNGGVVESSNGGMVELSYRRMVEWWNGGLVQLSNRRMVEWIGGLGLIISNGVHHPDPDPRCFTGDFSLFEIECARQFIACAILAVIAWAATQVRYSEVDNVYT